LQMIAEETELKMFEKKELDWAGSPLSILPLDAIKPLKDAHLLKTQMGLCTYFIRTNTEFAPLNQPLIRKAFALAINRQAIADYVTQGSQLPATGLVPLSFGLQKEPYFQDGNVEEARRLFQQGLAALHLTKEQLPEISYLYRAGERNHLIAQAIQQQWFEAFGIRIKLEAMEAKVYFGRVSKQDYHLAFGSWVADFADPINFLEVFKEKKGGSNNTLWENPQYADLLERSSQVIDPKQRFDLLGMSEQILMDEMPIIPVLYTNMLYVAQSGLKDVVFSSMGIDFKWASMEIK
jgi:oligopeptide transport system substrate-binding protein